MVRSRPKGDVRNPRKETLQLAPRNALAFNLTLFSIARRSCLTFEDLNRVAHVKVADCRDGVMIFNPLDRYIGRSLDLYGEFSAGETRLFSQLIKSGDTVIDVGANIGAHTLWMAQRAGPAGRVIAFEPQRSVFQMLCANMALNAVMNVDAYWAASGSQRGHITVPRMDPTIVGNFGALSLGTADEGDSVQLMSIDELNLDSCGFIKVDAEGMESDVLEGSRSTIRRTKPILYVENDRNDLSGVLIEAILSMEYNLWWHLPAYFNPNNTNKNSKNVFPMQCSINMLCIHKSVGVDVGEMYPVEGPEDTWLRVARLLDAIGLPAHDRPHPTIVIGSQAAS